MRIHELPEGFTDAVIVETIIKLDLRDRIRAILGQTLRVETQTFTEHKPGRCETHVSWVYFYNQNRKPKLEMGTVSFEIPK